MPEKPMKKSAAARDGLGFINGIGIIAIIVLYFVNTIFMWVVIVGLVAWNIMSVRTFKRLDHSGEYYLGEDVTILDISHVYPDSTPFAMIMDVETTGLLQMEGRPTMSKVRDYPSAFPRIVEIAWVTLDRNYRPVDVGEYIIRQEDPIPPRTIDIHGITDEVAAEQGHDILDVLEHFREAVEQCDYYVGHNVQFDKYVIESEFLRAGVPRPFTNMKKYDTQQMAKSLVERRKNTLEQAAVAVIGNDELDRSGVGFHSAMDDVLVTATIFKVLHKNGIKY